MAGHRLSQSRPNRDLSCECGSFLFKIGSLSMSMRLLTSDGPIHGCSGQRNDRAAGRKGTVLGMWTHVHRPIGVGP